MRPTLASSLCGSMVLLLVTALPARSATVVASEFFHGEMEHYFVTAFAAEEAALEAGDAWARTATQYRVHDAPGPGLVPVCRFFTASFAPLSSHFYTADATECEIVRSNPRWTFEGIAFFVKPAAADGSCAAGWSPVYRLYNDGLTGAPNHRYTPRRAQRAEFLARGWRPEGAGPLGVAFCVPVAPDDATERLRSLAESSWSFGWQAGMLGTIVTFDFGPVTLSFDPDLPYEVQAARLEGSAQGTAQWDPFLGKLVVMGWSSITPQHRLVFDVSTAGEVTGCAYVATEPAGVRFPPPPYVQSTYHACQPLQGWRN